MQLSKPFSSKVLEFNLQKRRFDLFRLIISTMPEAVVLIRVKDDVIVYCNPKFEEVFGYDSGELKEKHASILNFETYTQSAAQVNEKIVAQLKTIGDNYYDVKRVKKDGTAFWGRSRITQFEHSEFGPVWISVLDDITVQEELSEN